MSEEKTKARVFKVCRGKNNLEMMKEMGFKPYIADGEEEKETIYAVHIRLNPETSEVYRRCVDNFCRVYEMCSSEEREDFTGYDFYEVRNADTGKVTVGVNLTERQKDDFLFCQLCFAISGFGKYTLFINAPDKTEYYGSKVIEGEVGDFINRLKELKLIYKKTTKM